MGFIAFCLVDPCEHVAQFHRARKKVGNGVMPGIPATHMWT